MTKERYSNNRYLVYLKSMGPRRVFIPVKDKAALGGVRNDVFKLLPGLNTVAGSTLGRVEEELDELISDGYAQVYTDEAWQKLSETRRKEMLAGLKAMPITRSLPSTVSYSALVHVQELEENPKVSALIEKAVSKSARLRVTNPENFG